MKCSLRLHGRFCENRDLSLAIVAMNQRQRDHINEMMDRATAGNSVGCALSQALAEYAVPVYCQKPRDGAGRRT